MYVYYGFFIHSSDFEYLGYLYNLAIELNTAKDICIVWNACFCVLEVDVDRQGHIEVLFLLF